MERRKNHYKPYKALYVRWNTVFVNTIKLDEKTTVY
jgi:hypothetical protein